MEGVKDPRQSSLFALGIFLVIAISGCEEIPAAAIPSGTCATGTAQIAVWDGRIQKVCGCGGNDTEFAAPNTALNCTFSLGNILHIYFHGPFLQHQLRTTNSSTMPDTPVFDPNGPLIIRSHSFTPTAAGTYSFRDVFDATLFGDIVVTP